MSVPVKCPHCTKSLSISDSSQGKKIRCPGCKGLFTAEQRSVVAVDRTRVKEMASHFKWVLWVAFFTLPVFFGYLKFQGVDLISMGHHLEADLILKIAMAIYYFSWCAGAKF